MAGCILDSLPLDDRGNLRDRVHHACCRFANYHRDVGKVSDLGFQAGLIRARQLTTRPLFCSIFLEIELILQPSNDLLNNHPHGKEKVSDLPSFCHLPRAGIEPTSKV